MDGEQVRAYLINIHSLLIYFDPCENDSQLGLFNCSTKSKSKRTQGLVQSNYQIKKNNCQLIFKLVTIILPNIRVLKVKKVTKATEAIIR